MPTLIVNQGAIGDLLLSLPAMRLIRKYRGDFTLAGKPENALFIKAAEECSSALPSTATAFSELYSGVVHPILAYFDDIWWFTRRRGLVPTILMMPDSSKKAKVVFTVDESPERVHCSRFQFEMVRKSLGVDDEMKEFLQPLKYVRDKGDNTMFHMAIHPGSGSRKKNVPLESYLSIARRLLERLEWLKLVFILGPAEQDIVQKVEDFALSMEGRAKILFGQDLSVVADCLGRTSLFLGNDSGMAHLASWCGARCVVLFGPTDARLWAPIFDTIVVQSSANCSPCGERYRDCDKYDCMNAFDKDGLIELLERELLSLV